VPEAAHGHVDPAALRVLERPPEAWARAWGDAAAADLSASDVRRIVLPDDGDGGGDGVGARKVGKRQWHDAGGGAAARAAGRAAPLAPRNDWERLAVAACAPSSSQPHGLVLSTYVLSELKL
tara:strand:+ start:240 stop:605 length:366 start_codon:yes stop_codon:yes gene_type:complete